MFIVEVMRFYCREEARIFARLRWRAKIDNVVPLRVEKFSAASLLMAKVTICGCEIIFTLNIRLEILLIIVLLRLKLDAILSTIKIKNSGWILQLIIFVFLAQSMFLVY